MSGPIGRETIHYEAPSHDRLKKEMARFIKWCNATPDIDPVTKSALAHFWFVTIHPFEDGNGRIARAIADMMLARSEKTSQRFYSMSSQIQHERNAYYDILESCQKGALDITPWIEWFLNCLKHAIAASGKTLEAVLIKARFWKAHAGESFNDRQRKVINRMLDGFEGKLTSSKWAKLTKCSQDTALRDISDLVKHEGFKEEREWRAIYGPNRSPSQLIKSSTEVVFGIPQLVYNLPLDAKVDPNLGDLDFTHIFDRLIIGPSQYSLVMAEAFVAALTEIGVSDAGNRVVISNIPIRS